MNENSYVTITDIPVAMGFEEFVEAMRERLREEYPDCEVRAVSVTKNNDTHLTGIAVIPPGADLWTTVYVDGCYGEYLDGRTMEELVSDTVRCYEENRMEEDPALPDLTDFEALKDTVCLKLVNRQRNRENLAGMPHRDFLDLAVTYFIPVELDDSRDGSITVTDRHFGLWGTDEDTLYRHALENTRRLYPARLVTLAEVVQEMTGIRMKEKVEMYILYRGNREHPGASAMLDAPVLKGFAAGHGNFYILPSSIFEVMLVPAGLGPADAGYYSGMVRDVNRTQVEPEEVLSDNAYYYHADTGEIEILS